MNYRLNSVIKYRTITNTIRTVCITDMSSAINGENESGFTGVDLDDNSKVWGYDSDIVEIVSQPGYKAFWNIDNIKRFNSELGYHFFDKDAMRFFRSRIAPGVYAHGNHVNLFITSEQFDYRSDRLYTIRQLKPNGSIETIGEYQEYKSLDSARRAIKSGRAFTE